MIRYLPALLISASAIAAPVTVRVTMPTAYSDGTPLPAANRIGAQLYCGPTAGRYVQAWFGEGTGAVVDVVADLSARQFCALTAYATAPDGTGVRESSFSTEFVLNPNVPSSITTWSTSIQAGAICRVTCTVDRTR